MSIEENYYVIEVVKDKRVYLTDWVYEGGEVMIMGTTKDIYDTSIVRFSLLEQAKAFADKLYNDAFSDNPRPLKVKTELEIKEVL